MYRVSIYDKSNRQVSSYDYIHTIKYLDLFGETHTITGEEILTYKFPTSCSYQLLSDTGNYSINKSIIGTFEITQIV